MKVYDESIIDSIVDIYRTSPINPNYPHGMDCEICKKAGIECYTDSGDGYECNTGYVKYLEQKLIERKQPTVKVIPLGKVKKAREKISKSCYKACIDDDGVIRESKVLEILDELIESEE